MKRLKKNLHILQTLKNSNKKLRSAIIKNCSDDTIKAILEIAINTLNGNCQLSKHTHIRLKKFKNILRQLVCPKKNLKRKRKIIIQKGGFLPVLIGTILSGVIGKLLSDYQSRNE